MKELPDRLHNVVMDGLTMLLSLRLPGSPAADTAQAMAQTWSIALATGNKWKEERDIPRFQTAFTLLAAQCDRWPSPKTFLDALPPPPQRLMMAKRYERTPEQMEAARKALKQIRQGLANAPCMNRSWHKPEKTGSAFLNPLTEKEKS